MIVIGYQGIGKSTLAQKQFKYIDLESSALRRDGVRWHNWYEPYCLVAEWLSKQGYIVFVSSHKEVRDYLNEFCEEPFCLFDKISVCGFHRRVFHRLLIPCILWII